MQIIIRDLTMIIIDYKRKQIILKACLTIILKNQR